MNSNSHMQDFKDESQFATFWLGDRLYGIDVMKVQEVTQPLTITKVPLAPKFVIGLINLRGQISTAINLRKLFNMQPSTERSNEMSVVCRVNDQLISFLVDRIGDVIEVSANDFEDSPETIPMDVKMFMGGVYKTPDSILSIIDVDKAAKHIIEAVN